MVRPASAEPIYFEGWDAGLLAGWTANTIDATVDVVIAGGNPGGYLQTQGGAQFGFAIGAVGQFAPLTGDYAAAGNNGVSFDLLFASGTFVQAAFRVRYQDAANNGWQFPLTTANFASSTWQSFSISFDPTWSDAAALAAGWVSDGDPGLTFATTMSDVFQPEVRLSGSGAGVAGIDNFTLHAPVPEPATLTLLGLGVAGMVARRRTRRPF